MDLNYILENEKLNKFLEDSIGKTFYKFRLGYAIELDDFRQDVYIYLMKHLKNFDSEKSNIKTYIPLLIMTKARIIIRNSNLQRCDINVKNNMIMLDKIIDDEGLTSFYDFIKTDNSIEDITLNKVVFDDVVKNVVFSPQQEKVFHLLYKGYSHLVISKLMGLTRPYITQIFHDIRKKVTYYLKKKAYNNYNGDTKIN
jgi:RNA polymerase sigma factor (sigma-70 family)